MKPRLTLSLSLFVLVGEIVRVAPHDDGYTITTEEVRYRYTLDVNQPELSPGFAWIADLNRLPEIPTAMRQHVIYRDRRETLLPREALTQEDIELLEHAQSSGPSVTWRIEAEGDDPTPPADPAPCAPPLPAWQVVGVPAGKVFLDPKPGSAFRVQLWTNDSRNWDNGPLCA